MGDTDNDADRIKESLEDIRDFFVQQIRAYHQLTSLGGLYGKGDAMKIGAAVAERGPVLLAELASAALAAQTSAMKTGTEHFERISKSLFGDGTGSKASHIVFQVTVVPGLATTRKFRLRNPCDEAVQVEMNPAKIRKGTGEASIGQVDFVRVGGKGADDFRIDKGDTARFEARVAVNAGAAPGGYTATTHVLVGDKVLGAIEVQVSVEASAVIEVTSKGGLSSQSSSAWEIVNSSDRPKLVSVASPLSFGATPMRLSIVEAADHAKLRDFVPAGTALGCGLKVEATGTTRLAAGSYEAKAAVYLGDELFRHFAVRLTVLP